MVNAQREAGLVPGPDPQCLGVGQTPLSAAQLMYFMKLSSQKSSNRLIFIKSCFPELFDNIEKWSGIVIPRVSVD